MTAFVPYITFMKHAKKVAKSQTAKSRPVLGTVIHRENYVAVTDSHRLYMATGLYEGDEKQVDPNSGLEVNHGTYPEIGRLIQDAGNAKYSHEINVDEAYEAIRAIELADKVVKVKRMMLQISNGQAFFKTDDIAAFFVEYITVGTSHSDAKTAYVDIKYMKEAFQVLKDAKVEYVTLHYFGSKRPIQLRAGNFTAIILPIRKAQ